MTTLGEQLLATPAGAAFLACGAAVGRLDEALRDPGLTLCLAAHALAEVRRGTDRGRIASFVADPGDWLRAAATAVDAADCRWWSTPAHGRVLRQTDDHTASVELADARGRPRSAAEEADAHLHTFTSRDRLGPPRRFQLSRDAQVLTIDGPDDVDTDGRAALRGHRAADAPAVHLTLRGALTVPRASLPAWPWDVAGVHWPAGAPVDGTISAPLGPETRVTHDHGWPAIGRPYDPRFDEGDEVDGSELHDSA